AADTRGKAVRLAFLVLLVAGDVEGLANQRPLERDVLRAARAERLVLRPTDRAVIDDGIVATGEAHAVECLARLVAGADADVANDQVLGAKAAEVVVREADALARCGLPRDGEVAIPNDQSALEHDAARHVKNYRPRPFGLNRFAERARS